MVKVQKEGKNDESAIITDMEGKPNSEGLEGIKEEEEEEDEGEEEEGRRKEVEAKTEAVVAEESANGDGGDNTTAVETKMFSDDSDATGEGNNDVPADQKRKDAKVRPAGVAEADY